MREYVDRNQQLAFNANAALQEASMTAPDHLPDFTQAVMPFTLKRYAG